MTRPIRKFIVKQRWDYEPSECYMGKKRRNRSD